MNRNFLGRTLFYDKILISQKKVHRIIMVFEEKKIFRKTGLSAKPEYPENRETCQTFFSRFSPKIKFSTSPCEKNHFSNARRFF